MATAEGRKISDENLIRQIRAGNKVAFGSLYNRYWEELFNFGLNRLHDEAATKDVIQDIFFHVWNNRKRTEITHVKAYLYQSVRYGVLKKIKATEFKECDLGFLLDEPSTNQVDEIIQFNETQRKIDILMEALPNRSREVFYLSRFESLSNAQIAYRLEMSKSTVEWHISQALKLFRQHLTSELYLTLLAISLLLVC